MFSLPRIAFFKQNKKESLDIVRKKLRLNADQERNLERAYDATHGFALSGYNINLSLEPGEAQTIEFDADQAGVFDYYCTEFCSALHLEMNGYFMVKPSDPQAMAK